MPIGPCQLEIESSDIFNSIVDGLSVGLCVVGPNMKILLWNQYMTTYSRRKGAEVVGQDLFESFPELPELWLRRKLKSVWLLKGLAYTRWQERPYLFKLSHNRPVTGGVENMMQDCTFIPIFDKVREVKAVCIAIRDATDNFIYHQEFTRANDELNRTQNQLQRTLSELRSVNQVLDERSRTDGLTGLFNRAHIDEIVKDRFEESQLSGNALSIILFDFDHFKMINDTYGHAGGDAVLKGIAARLKGTIRGSDILGRFGGEEFVMILPNTPADKALSAAKRLCAVVNRAPVRFGGRNIDVTISLGVSTSRGDSICPEALIQEADMALYYCKEMGRNQAAAYTPTMAKREMPMAAETDKEAKGAHGDCLNQVYD